MFFFLFYLILDALIRQYLSTSPTVEKEDFAHSTKEALKVLITHPEPLKTIFANNQPLRYKRKSDGFWELTTNQAGSS